jgi:hypothetical protein
VDNPVLAWFPIANLFLLTEITGKPSYWLFGFLIPGVNLALYAVLWMEIACRLKLDYYLGLLILVPLVGPFAMMWIAVSGEQEPQPDFSAFSSYNVY